MSKPDLYPEQSTAGIAVDPRTLERVIPESRRPDGTVRKQKKIRPGFTPQEDVSRFRGTRQAQMDATALPKGHVIGWIPPAATSSTSAAKTKSAKKNEKRKEKRNAEKVKVNWEDDDEDDGAGGAKESAAVVKGNERDKKSVQTAGTPTRSAAEDTRESTNVEAKGQAAGDELVDKLSKLDVR